MSKHPKRPRDPAQLAKLIVDIATGQQKDIHASDSADSTQKLGGQKGGKARARKLSALQRTEIARKAAHRRWGHD